MSRLRGLRRALQRDRRAVTALEYTLITAIIGGVVLACCSYLGGQLNIAYGVIENALSAQVSRLP